MGMAVLFFEDLADARIQNGQHLVDFLWLDGERGPERDPMRIEPAQQPVLEGPPANPHTEAGLGRKLSFGRYVGHKLDRLKQPLPPDVADHAVFFCELLETLPQAGPLFARVAAQVALQDFMDDGDPPGAGHRTTFPGVPFDETGVFFDRPPEDVGDLLP